MAKTKTTSSKDYGMIFLVIAILLVLALTVYVIADGTLQKSSLLTDKSLINSTASILGKYPAGVSQQDLDEVKILIIEMNPFGGEGYTLSFGYDDALAMIKGDEAAAEARRADPDYEDDRNDERSVEDLLSAAYSENNIKDFSGLSLFTNVEYLVLSGPNLQYTMENMKELKDLSFVEGMKSLTNLNITNTAAEDFAPVGKLPALKSLSIVYNRIRDTGVFANLASLEFLNITVGDVSDIAFIANLTNLKDLYLRGGGIEDLTAVQNLGNLRDLVLDSNEIEDVSPLRGLNNLKTLNLNDNNIINISAISGLSGLENLYLGKNQIEDAAPAFSSSFSLLKTLSLNENNLSESKLPEFDGARLRALKTLDISGNGIADIAPLAGLASVENLYADNNIISDISPLGSLAELAVLSLSGNMLTNVSALGALSNLKAVYIDENFIDDFSVLDALEESGVFISGKDSQFTDYDYDFDFDDHDDHDHDENDESEENE